MSNLTKLIAGLIVAGTALTSSADIVGFFHTGANSLEVYTASGGDLQPTEILVEDGSGVYGDLTLTLDPTATQFKLTIDSDTYYETAPLLTSNGNLANDNMWDNGLDMDGDIPGPYTHVLSGLTIGQEYRIQYTATMRYPSASTATLAIDLTAEESGSEVGTATLGTTFGPTAVRDWGHSSSYLQYTATQTTLDLTFLSTGSTDNKILTGLIVETIPVPEPATTGLLGLGAISLLLIRRSKNHA